MRGKKRTHKIGDSAAKARDKHQRYSRQAIKNTTFLVCSAARSKQRSNIHQNTTLAGQRSGTPWKIEIPIVKLIQETGENALLLGERGSGDKGCRWQQQQYKHIRDKG